MDQDLIEKLWIHTNKVEEENNRNIVESTCLSTCYESKKEAEPIPSKVPLLLPASMFLRDSGSSLFMSFHHEKSNQTLHYHDFFELIYVCKGNPIGIINNQEILLHEGNLCIMNPNAVHYFKKYSLDTDLVLNILLPKDIFQKSLFQILFHDPMLNSFFIRYRIENEKQPSFLFLSLLDKDVDYLIEFLLKEYLNKKEYSNVIIESLLTLIFSCSLRNYKGKVKPASSAASEIIDYIFVNYQNISIESVAEHFNYHPKYLSSIIHKETGQTYRELMVHIKLQNSLNYILYTDYSMEKIIDLIGYKDKSSFYQLFKKVYGITPSKYRELNS